MTPKRIPRRVVRVALDYDYGDYANFQLNFMDRARGRILPATRVFHGDELVFESNSLGCKGAELEDGRPVIGVFGDSVVQGVYMDSFVSHIHVGPCQTLNGGVEGSRLEPTVDRFLEIQAKAPMVCALVHTGWHNLIHDRNTEEVWREQLDRVQGPPVIGHFRLVADFHSDILTTGYTYLFGEGYAPWHDSTSSPDGAAHLKAHIDRFNRFIEAYCAERGRLLIDLELVLAPKAGSEVGDQFFDPIHPRVSAYGPIGKAISRQIEAQVLPLVQGSGLGAWVPDRPKIAAAAPKAATGPAADIGRTYPLW